MREFSTIDVVRILGIPRERLRYWIDNGIVVPTRTEEYRRGIKSIFTVPDLYYMELIKESRLNKKAPTMLADSKLCGISLETNLNWSNLHWVDMGRIIAYVDLKVEAYNEN